MSSFRRSPTPQDFACAPTPQDSSLMANQQYNAQIANQPRGNTGSLEQMLEETLALYSKPMQKPAAVVTCSSNEGVLNNAFRGDDFFEDASLEDVPNQYAPAEQPQCPAASSVEWVAVLPPSSSCLSGVSSQMSTVLPPTSSCLSSGMPYNTFTAMPLTLPCVGAMSPQTSTVEIPPYSSFVPMPSSSMMGAVVAGGGEMPATFRHIPARTTAPAQSASFTSPSFNPREFTNFNRQSSGPGDSDSESGFPFMERVASSDSSATLPPKAKQPQTTLMIRNVPINYTQDMLLRHWPCRGTYNFLYLPGSTEGEQNLSYAFINFTTEAHAEAFKNAWQKKRLPRFSARKSLNISYADVQGLYANLLHSKKKHARRLKVHQGEPAIFKDGRRVPVEEAMEMLEEERSKGQSNGTRIEGGAPPGLSLPSHVLARGRPYARALGA